MARKGWRNKDSDLSFRTGLMATKLGGLMVKEDEGLTFIVIVRKSITFYIWRIGQDEWAVSAYDIDFENFATFSRAGDITLFMLDFE